MDGINRMRNRFSQGRRSSVDPIKFSAEDSCLMATEEKRVRSGIPRIVAPSCSKRRSSSSDRIWSVSKMGGDNTLGPGSTAGLLFTPQNPVTPRVSLSARKAIDCISQLSAKSHTARKDQRTALDKNAQIRLSRHVASYLNKTGLVGDLLAGGQGRAPSGPIQSNDLKNMNKGAFITLFNLLYKKVGSRRKVDFNSSNYHESIPTIAKKLGYPGVIYKSHLLTPSTPHSWPYVIAFLGWMVDLVEFQQPFELALENAPDCEAMAVKDFYVKSYAAYLSEDIEDPSEENTLEFRSAMCAIRNTQPEVMVDLRERRNKMKALVDPEEECLNSIMEQKEKEKAEIQDLISEIEHLGTINVNQNSEMKIIENNIGENEKKKEMHVSKLEQLKREKESLKVICSKQKLSKPEWDQLVAENKEIRRANQMLIEMCDQRKKRVDSLDLKMSSIRNKLHKVWFDITEASMSIQPDSAETANLLKLIENFSHLAPEARLNFEEIRSTLHHALAEITPRVAQDQARAKALQDKICEISIEAQVIQKKKEKLMKEVESLQSELRLTENQNKEEEEQLRIKIHQVEHGVMCIQKTASGDFNVELEKTKEMYIEKLNKLDVKKQNYANCLGDMREMAEDNLKTALEKMTFFQSEIGKLSKEIAKFKKAGELTHL